MEDRRRELGGFLAFRPARSDATYELLNLGAEVSSLRVAARWSQRAAQDWAETEIVCDALPFAGTVRDALLIEDLSNWSTALRDFRAPGRLVLGGDRAAEVTLDVEYQVGGAPGIWAVEVNVVRSGDDPWPALRYLIFDVEPFVDGAAAAADALLAAR